MFRAIMLALVAVLLAGCSFERSVQIHSIDGLQTVDFGEASLVYYGDYEFAGKPKNWKHKAQLISANKLNLRGRHYVSGSTFIEPWFHAVVFEIPKQGPLNEISVREFFNHKLIESYDSQTLSSGAISARFWINPDKQADSESKTQATGYDFFSTLIFDGKQNRYCVMHWNFSFDDGESLRRESAKIFDSLQIK